MTIRYTGSYYTIFAKSSETILPEAHSVLQRSFPVSFQQKIIISSIYIYHLQEAVSQRLKHYRETTLPMLKTLDEEDRLRVVDGDKDEEKVKI